MKYLLILFLLPLLTTKPAQNLIPNGDFESNTQKYSSDMFSKSSKEFDNKVSYWSSPTLTDPDILIEENGNAIAGIAAGGGHAKAPHWNEFLQVKLKQPLVKGKTYQLKFQVRNYPLYPIRELGLLFTLSKINLKTYSKPAQKPQLTINQLKSVNYEKWDSISLEFIANEPHQYFIFGNFNHEENYIILGAWQHTPNMPYYMFDDFSLTQID